MRSQDQAKIFREIFLRSFFPTRPPQRLAQALVAVMVDHEFGADEVIFEAQSPPRRVFFVVEGEVHLESDDGDVWTFDEQSVIGIGDAVLDRPRARRAVAKVPTHALSLNFDDYLEILEDNFDFAKAALENAYRTIHEGSRQLAPDGVFKPAQTTPAVSAEILMQRRLNLVERLLVLYNAPLFLGAPVQPLVSLSAQAEEERWSEDEVLFEPGQPDTALRFVVIGRVRADLEVPRVWGWFGPGDLIGAHAAIAYPVTQYRMTAEAPTITLRIQKEDLYDLMEDHQRLMRVGFAFAARENERARVTRAARNRSEAAVG